MLKQSVRSAPAACKARLETEKQEDKKKGDEAEQKKKKAGRLKKAKEEITKSKQSLEEREDTLMKGEDVVRANLKAADKIISDPTSKPLHALSATTVNNQSMNVATMMLDAAKTKREHMMQSLEGIGQKRKGSCLLTNSTNYWIKPCHQQQV